MALQHVALAAAVADLVPDVEGRALLETVQQLARITAGVAGKGCDRDNDREKERQIKDKG